MTKADWDNSADVMSMIRRQKPSERKLMLFAIACVRQKWNDLPDPSQVAVFWRERNADGSLAPFGENAAKLGWDSVGTPAKYDFGNPAAMALNLFWCPDNRDPSVESIVNSTRNAATILRDIVNPFASKIVRYPCPYCSGDPQFAASGICRNCNVRGEVFVSWLTPQVIDLAQAAYDKRHPDGRLEIERLLVLSDAAEEAGCTDNALLNHLRRQSTCTLCAGKGIFQRVKKKGGPFDGPLPMHIIDWSDKPFPCPSCRGSGITAEESPVYRGAWSLDLILGKS